MPSRSWPGDCELMTLRKGAVLERHPWLNLTLESNGRVRVDGEHGTFQCGPHGLAVLDVFSEPVTLQKALETLKPRTHGVQDFMDLTRTIVELHRLGVLREKGESPALLAENHTGYDSAPIHVAMLNDVPRTRAYLDAIDKSVRAGDIVVEAGTGTGVLAVAAVRAGAEHVYAIEASAISRVAHELFVKNGLSDRITLIQGWSTAVELPRRGNVLISELIGNEPLGERVLEVTLDAKKRHLTPNCRFIPSRVKVLAIPVTIPDSTLEKWTFTPRGAAEWASRYGIDFSAAVESGRRSAQWFNVKPYDARGWQRFSTPLVVAEVDLASVTVATLATQTDFEAGAAGILNGILFSFEIGLVEGVSFSTEPGQIDSAWRSAVCVLPNPVAVAPRQTLALEYTYAGGSAKIDLVAC